jgi:WD40 repeat protein
LLAVIEDVRAVLPDGVMLNRGRVSVWDTTTGNQIRQLPPEPVRGKDLGFLALAFTEDSKQLLTSGTDGFLRVWDPATGKELRKIPFDPRSAHVLTPSKDGKVLAAASGTAIHFLDLPSGKAYEPPEGQARANANSFHADLSPDGRTAVTGSWENELLVWDVNAGRIRQQLDEHNNQLSHIQISRDGRTLFSRDIDNVLRFWDISRGKKRSQIHLQFTPSWSTHLTVSPDNSSLFLADPEGNIYQLDATTGRKRNRFQGPKYLWELACTPDGRSLVGWSGDRKIRIWDAANGRLQHEYTVPENIQGSVGLPGPKGGEVSSHYSATLSPDGRLLAMGSPLGQVAPDQRERFALIFKDLSTGRDLALCDPLPSGQDVLVFSPDGRTLAWSGSMDPAVHLLEVASGRERCRLAGHRGQVKTLHFSATGDRLLSASFDTTVLIWDLGVDHVRSQPSLAELEALWTDLAGEGAARGYQAIKRLAAAPNVAIPFLRKRLRSVPVVDQKWLVQLIADLDSDNFANRQNASEDLAKLGEQALPAYRKALNGKPPLETRRRLDDLLDKAQRAWWDTSGERLRSLRAIETLELSGAKEAHELLETLAAGAEGARLTEEAKAALKRQASRKSDDSP